MLVKDLLYEVNEKGKDIYAVSKEQDFGASTLRQRLISLGYTQDKETRMWIFSKDDGTEPLDNLITYPLRRRSSSLKEEDIPKQAKENKDLFSAVLQLPATDQVYTDSFKTDKALAVRMKKFIKMVSLPSGKMYSLAIREFLEKYEPQVLGKLGNQFNNE